MIVMKHIGNSNRCPWVDLSKPDYVEYHDKEWGVPVHDDKLIFEFLTLEGAQAGLSWYTVLRKREAYRKAFADFDPEKIARYGKRTENPRVGLDVRAWLSGEKRASVIYRGQVQCDIR